MPQHVADHATVEKGAGNLDQQWIGWAILAAFAAFHIVATLGYVFRKGRLSIIPIFDDVAYLLDGMTRLAEFDRAGLFGLFYTFVTSPPHSPLTSFLSTVGFAITPGSPAGAYASGAVWVVVVLCLGALLMGQLRTLSRVGVLCAILAVPMLTVIIGSFRPDAAWGLLTGCAAMFVVTTDLVRSSGRRIALIGFLIGFAGISKSTGMPAATVVIGIAYLCSFLISVDGFKQECVRIILWRTVVLGVCAGIVVLPYLALAGESLWSYIFAAMVRDASIWQFKGSLSDQLLYYIRIPGWSNTMLGWLWPSGLVFLMSVAAISVRKGNRHQFWRCVAVLVVVGVSYAIPAISPVKSPFIGSLFYGTFVIACVWSLGQLLEALPIAPTIVAGAGVLVFALWWSPSNDLITATDPNFVAMDKANRALAPVIFREISLAGEKVDGEAEALSTVLIASPGPVFDASLEFLARLQGVRAKFTALYTAQSWPEVANSVAAANVIVATESGALGQGVGFTYPVIGFQNRLIGMLQQDPSVRTIGTYTDPTGHRTIAFAWRRGGGARVTKISGFRSLEGPYPDLRLPKFRWMTGLNAAVEVVALEAVEATLELRCKAVNPTVLTATIKDGGSSQVRLEGPFNGDFSRLNLKISLKPDQPVVVELKAVPEVEIPKGWPGPLLCAPFSLSSQ